MSATTFNSMHPSKTADISAPQQAGQRKEAIKNLYDEQSTPSASTSRRMMMARAMIHQALVSTSSRPMPSSERPESEPPQEEDILANILAGGSSQTPVDEQRRQRPTRPSHETSPRLFEFPNLRVCLAEQEELLEQALQHAMNANYEDNDSDSCSSDGEDSIIVHQRRYIATQRRRESSTSAN